MAAANPTTLAEDFLRRYPPTGLKRPFLMQLTREQIEETDRAWPGFKDSLRTRSLAAVAENDVDIVRRALQSLAFVGKTEDVAHLQELLRHPAAQVAADTRTCIFEIEHREPE
jgi:hypothetical protein